LQFSCVSDVEFEVNDGNSRIFLYSEFEPQEAVAFKYSTAVGLNDLIEEVNPTVYTDLQYDFRKDNVELATSFRYDVASGLFISPFNAQNIEEGMFYSINSSMNSHPEFKSISATTYIPLAQEFSSLEVSEDRSYIEDGILHVDKDIIVTTDVSHDHYEIEAFVYNPKEPTNVEKLTVRTIERTTGVTNVDYRNSVLVQSRKLNNQYAVLNISASLDLELQDINEGINLKLKTVNADHYQYHLTVAKEYETIYAPLSEPVINFTNIENGIGLFSGFSSVTEVLEF